MGVLFTILRPYKWKWDFIKIDSNELFYCSNAKTSVTEWKYAKNNVIYAIFHSEEAHSGVFNRIEIKNELFIPQYPPYGAPRCIN